MWDKKTHAKSSMEAKEHQFALFIGRWQIFHDGHKALFQQVLDEGKRVCIAIRDCPVDEKNQKPALKVYKEITTYYDKLINDGMVEVIVIPDISSVCFGREVGYDIVEYLPPQEIAEISATKLKQESNGKH